MSINATLFVQLVVFFILAWFTMRFVWPPITKALDERARKISDGLSAADQAKAELSKANRRVEQELALSRQASAERLAEAQKQVQALLEEAKRKADEEAKRIIEQARVDANQQIVAARDQLRDQVAVLAVRGAEAILRREINAQTHAQMLGDLKAQL